MFLVLGCKLEYYERFLTLINIFLKLILYKLMIRPILIYAAAFWSNTSTTNYRHLQTLQSKCLRATPYRLTTHRRYPLPTDWQHTDGIHSLPTDNTQTVSTPYRLTTHRRYPLPTDWLHTDGIHSLPSHIQHLWRSIRTISSGSFGLREDGAPAVPKHVGAILIF
jgi:hypothetical protein